MDMKHLLYLLVATALLGFTACSDDDKDNNKDNNTNPSDAISAFFPEGYSASDVAAWYLYSEVQQDGTKRASAVFLFNDNTIVVTNHKIKSDGREYKETDFVGTYEITNGNYDNGTAYVPQMDMSVTIENGKMTPMGEETFTKQSNANIPAAPKSALDNISDNQISINGQVYDLDAILAVRPAQGEDVGAHYLDITPNNADKDNDFLGRFDIGTPLMGVNINLADPLKAVGSNQFSVGITDRDWEKTFYAMDCVEDYIMSRINGVEYENSGFKEGSFIAKHGNDGFTLQMHGTLNNDQTIAIKVSVPESAVDYWN